MLIINSTIGYILLENIFFFVFVWIIYKKNYIFLKDYVFKLVFLM